MQITDIKVRKLMHEGRLRAVVSVTIGDELAIHDIKVIEGPQRLFVAMPSRREVGGVFRDIAHPITPAARRQLEDAILAVYRRERAEADLMQQVPYGDYWESHFDPPASALAAAVSTPAAAVSQTMAHTGG